MIFQQHLVKMESNLCKINVKNSITYKIVFHNKRLIELITPLHYLLKRTLKKSLKPSYQWNNKKLLRKIFKILKQQKDFQQKEKMEQKVATNLYLIRCLILLEKHQK